MKMATDKDSFCQTCTSDPNFAVICSFLDKFAIGCGIAHPTFAELQEMLEDTQEVSQVLVDIHIKLLRKLRKSFTVDKWERAAAKFCHTYSQQDGWELERFGYKKSRLGVKLKLLKCLLEAQFDCNNRFKTEVNKLSTEELRLEPLGRDQAGLTYWCQFDPAAHVRVYREDVDDETWQLIAKDREDLVNLINSLSSGENLLELETPVNEDSTSQEIEKPITDTGQVEEEEEESGEEEEEEESQMSKDDSKENMMKKGDTESDKVSERKEIAESEVDLSSGTSDSVVSGVDLSMKIEKNPNPKSGTNIYQVKQVEGDRVDILNHMSAKFNEDKRQAEDLSINNAKRPRLELEDSEGPVSLVKKSNLNGTSGRGSHGPVSYVVGSGTGAESPEDEVGESEEEPEFSDEVEDPVMLVRGEGSGAECDVGNLRRIECATELETSSGVTRTTGAQFMEDLEQPKFSDEVEEPVMLVRGEGSGAECDVGNLRRIECATELETSSGVTRTTGAQFMEDLEQPKFSDEVEEPVMLVRGEGSGPECDVGNLRRIDSAIELETSSELKKETGTQFTEDKEEPQFSEVIEEPVMYVLGQGSGEASNMGNVKYHREDESSQTLDDQLEFSEVIEEPVMFFGGQGSGVECCVGNPKRPDQEEHAHHTPKETSLLGIEASMKNVSLNQHEPKFSEVIEEPVMWVRGVGCGEDCLTGNPDEKEEEGHKSPERKPKLWSIDTICSPEKGTTSAETTEDGPMKFFFGPGSLEKKVDVKLGGPSHEGNGPLPTTKSGEASTSSVDGLLEDSIAKIVESADPCTSQSNPVVSDDSPGKILDEKCSSPKPLTLSEASPAVPDIKDSEADNCTLSNGEADSEEVIRELADIPKDGVETECLVPDKRDTTESVEKEDKTVEENSCLEKDTDKTSQQTEESCSSSMDASTADSETKKLEICKKNYDEKELNNESVTAKNNSSSNVPNGPILNDCLTEDSKDGGDENPEETSLVSNSKGSKLETVPSISPCPDDRLQNGNGNPSVEKIDVEDVAAGEKKDDKTKNVMLTNIIEICLDNNTPKSSVKSDLKDLINAKYNDLFSAKNLDAPSHIKGSSPAEGNSESSKTDQEDPETTNEGAADIEKIVDIKEEIKKEASESLEKNENTKETIESPKEDVEAQEKVEDDSSLRKIKEEEFKKENMEDIQSEDKLDEKCEKVENVKKTEIKKGKANNKKGNKTSTKVKIDEAIIEANGQDKDPARGRKSRTNSINSEQEVEVPNKIRKTSNEEPNATESNTETASVEVEKKLDSTEEVPRRASRRLARSASMTVLKAVAKKEPKKKGGKGAKGKKNTAEDEKEEKEEVEEGSKDNVDTKTEEEPTKDNEEEKKCGSLANFSLEAPLDDSLPVLGKPPNFKKTESRKRRSSRRLSKSEEELGEQTGVAEEEEEEAGGKKPRLRGKTKMTKGKAKTRSCPPVSSSEEEEGTEDTKKSKGEKESTSKIRGRTKKQKCVVSKGGRERGGDSTDSSGAEGLSGEENRSPERSGAAEDQKEEDEEEKPKKKKKKEPPPKTTTPRKKKNTGLLGLTENDLRHSKPVLGAEGGADSGVRQSRRIAQLKIKEEAERRAIEEATYLSIREMKKNKIKEKMDRKDKKSVKKKSKSRKETDEEEEEEEEEAYIEPVEDKKKSKKKKKKNDRLSYDINKPWQSSSGSSEEDVEEEEEHYDIEYEDEEDLRAQQLVSDHEFSPESDLEESEEKEPTPVRRARTAKKEDGDAGVAGTGGEAAGDEEAASEDFPCQKCGELNHPEWILLCDKCDQGYHASCLRPPLMLIPEGDWFCPPCQHAELVMKLRDTLRTFDKSTKKRENEELRRKRLAYVGISLANVISLKERGGSGRQEKNEGSSCSSSTESSSSSEDNSTDEEPVYQLRARRAALQTNYRFNDYDELINSAIQDEMEAVKGAGNQGRGKDIANIVEAGDEEEANGENGEARPNQEELKEGEEEEGGDWRPPVVPRYTSLPSRRRKPKRLNNLDVESDENGDSDEDFKGTSEEEDEETDSDKDSDDSRLINVRRSSRHRVSRIDKEFINDESDSSDEPRRKKSRRLWASSESSDSSDWGKKKKKPTHRVYSRLRTSGGKKKKKQLFDSDSDRPKKLKTKKPKIKFGLSEDDDDEPARRTRGKKISYLEVAGSDTEEEVIAKSRKLPSEDEEEFVPDKEEDQEDEEEEVEDVKYDSNDDEISNKDEREGEQQREVEVEDKEEDEEEEEVKDSRKEAELADGESPDEEEDAGPPKSEIPDGEELEGELEEEEIEEEIEEEVDEEEEEEEEDVGLDVSQEEKEEPRKKEEPEKETAGPVKEKSPIVQVKVKEEEKEVVTPQIRLVPPSKLLAQPVKVRTGALLGGPTGGFYRPSLPSRSAPLPYRQAPSRYDPSRFGLPPYQPPPPTSYYPPGAAPFPGGPPSYGGPPTTAEEYGYMEESSGGGPDEEGMFGGLVSYFSSQREDNLDT